MNVSGATREIEVNDVHSGLNRTRVSRVLVPQSVDELAREIRILADAGSPISVSGCRHAMGGQQFASGGTVIDCRGLNRMLAFDQDRGLLRAEGGIQWPDLITGYLAAQEDGARQWGIAQKQTGADTFTLGGSLAANAHGRGLTLGPIIQDVESFTLVKADGGIVRCSRDENRELFRLVIGGYGLFGVIADVTLRLVPRQRLERVVEIVRADELADRFEQRIVDGFLYGDFQFSIDEASEGFLQVGVFSCYRPTDRAVPMEAPRHLEEENWLQLLYLAYTDRARVFEEYAGYYLSTNGQTYWSDTHQLGPYLPDYARRIQDRLGTSAASSLLITEIYVPGIHLQEFLLQAALELRRRGVIVIYGTVRLIERDSESFLAWAKERYSCVIFNLLIEHTAGGMAKAEGAFRSLIDLATSFGGSFYLTYHRYATAEQVHRCYPQFDQFLELKRLHDPGGIWQSDWWRHYEGLFAA